jgi:acyl-CoA reductase-like NAD-dependent aldehyde dehydrogenase
LTGGTIAKGPGYFYPVTLIADAENGLRIVNEEQFGPALPIIRYRRLEDAIRWANETDYGLAASVWGSDRALISEVAKQLEAGTVYVNKHAEVAPNIPFGGVKSSGLGVEFGVEGLQAYTTIKVINAAI